MKQKLLLVVTAVTMFCLLSGFRHLPVRVSDTLTGAWQTNSGSQEEMLLFADGYMTHTIYKKAGKQFIQTRGGTYTLSQNKLDVNWEFDTRDKEQVGQTTSYTINSKGGKMTAAFTGSNQTWQQVDQGRDGLSGLWHITARKQEGGLVPIHQAGTRKTVKILTGTRFQWAAIDPGTKSFMGSGGGTYSFKEGKYTEHIEFFSRDSSRVGSSLSFDGKLENGDWHHSGLSSKGDPIYEVWSRKK